MTQEDLKTLQENYDISGDGVATITKKGIREAGKHILRRAKPSKWVLPKDKDKP